MKTPRPKGLLELGPGRLHQRQQCSDFVGLYFDNPQVTVEPSLPFQKSCAFFAFSTGKARFETALGADILIIGKTLRRGPVEVFAAVTQPLSDEYRPGFLRALLFDSSKSAGGEDAADES